MNLNERLFRTSTSWGGGDRRIALIVGRPTHYERQAFLHRCLILYNLGRKRFIYFSLHFCITVHHHRKLGQKSNRTGTWRQEMMQRPWRHAAYYKAYFLKAYSTCFVIEPRTNQSAHNGLGPPKKKNPYRLVYRPIL